MGDTAIPNQNGVTFFNFGGKCMVRLFVALETLRRHYNGPITLMLAKDDPFNEQAASDLQQYAQIQWFDMERLAKRNLKCALKPQLFRASPYLNTLMLDGDLVFQADVTPLFAEIERGGFLLTKFSTWNADGSKMSARVAQAREYVTPAQFELASAKTPAVNIGVMGWRRGCPTLDPWEDLTKLMAGKHIADEIAAQVVYPGREHVLMGQEWNYSCVYGVGDHTQAKVLHYHGDKHTELKRPTSRVWLHEFRQLVFSGKVRKMFTYLTWGDPSLEGRLKATPSLLNPNQEFSL